MKRLEMWNGQVREAFAPSRRRQMAHTTWTSVFFLADSAVHSEV